MALSSLRHFRYVTPKLSQWQRLVLARNNSKTPVTSQQHTQFSQGEGQDSPIIERPEEIPLPTDDTPRIPKKGSYSQEACEARLKWVEEFTNTKLPGVGGWWPKECKRTSEDLKGNIEQPIGLVKIPLSVAGPMLFTGAEAKGWFLAPVAATEGALVASISRGAKAISMSGGVQTWATQQRMTRAPMFFLADPLQAVALGEWAIENRARIQEQVVKNFSQRAVLKEILPAYDAEACHLLLRYETGDAAGQNMTTVCSWETAKWINEHAPKELGININYFSVEGNLCADKKVSGLNALIGRGVSVTARAEIPENILQNVLGISSHTITESIFRSHRISERIGQHAGFNVNVSNVLGAMFIALGQDIACVHESAIARFEVIRRHDHPENGIITSMYLPSLVVGTVGGGTMLPTQRECLDIVGCYGVGKVRKLAEIVCGYCLALDLSTFSAVMGGQLAEEHDRLGRNRPEDK